MITEIFVVYNSQIDKMGDSLKESPIFTFIDESIYKNRKKAFALKNHWGARMTPFAICMDKDKAVKAFYSESKIDVVESLINYLKDEGISVG